ncbi:hypothetical protein [Phenylobacterium sp.]|jgi:hypothetical protein|uniref:hypothetical protein n=1 Tax=Phenylobacterium sp. TaxID=1871053 RepID=UPI002F40664B
MAEPHPEPAAEPANPQDDWGEPDPKAIHGENHTRRPDKTEAERGQGRRTVERNREIAKGGLYK